MKMKKLAGGCAALAVALAVAAPAAADVTVGTVTKPSGATAATCTFPASAAFVAQYSGTSAFTIPTNGKLTSWESDVEGGEPGASLGIIVLDRKSGGGAPSYTVVGSDIETVPLTPPAGGVATFTPSTPIEVSEGDIIALYVQAGTGSPVCYYEGGATPEADELVAGEASTTPGAEVVVIGSPSGRGYRLDLAATIMTGSPNADVSVTTSAGPEDAVSGQLVQLVSTVSNAGPGAAPITFTDKVPSGLTVSSAVAGSGTCSVAGGSVTCALPEVAAGMSVPVVVTAVPSGAGSYLNETSVATSRIDGNLANNAASATLKVAAPPAPPAPAECEVPPLKGTPLAIAKRILTLLDCVPGAVILEHSKLAKGAVIKTEPGEGATPAGTSVSLVVSGGLASKAHKLKGKGDKHKKGKGHKQKGKGHKHKRGTAGRHRGKGSPQTGKKSSRR